MPYIVWMAWIKYWQEEFYGAKKRDPTIDD